MKSIRLLLIIVFLVVSISVIPNLQGQEWSEELLLSPGTNPDLTVNKNNGQLHIVSIVASKGVLYLNTDKFGNVLDSVVVPNTSGEEGLLKFGPTIGVDTDNNPHVGYRIHRGNNKYDVYYTYRSTDNWSSPLLLGARVIRGYVARIAVDDANRVHFAHGSVDESYPNITGPVHYYQLSNGSVDFEQHNVDRIRGDERFELDVHSNGIVDLVTSDLHYPPDPPDGGPIYYWRSRAAGDSLTYRGDIHDLQTRNGANGSSDVFVDASGNTHVVYGAEMDVSVSNQQSVRYSRQENGITVLDKRITDAGEITKTEKVPLGVASIAASNDGEIVIIAYITQEDGPLYTRISYNGGVSWSEPQLMSSGWNTAEARNKQIIRAYRGDFFLVYPTGSGIALRSLLLTPNEPPTAMLAEVEPAIEGSTVTFDATGSYDNDGNITECYWDFQNDGIFDDTTTAFTNTWLYVDDFEGEATVTVIDNEGEFDSDTTNVVITNSPPVADAGGPYSTTWYTPVNLIGDGTDIGVEDILSFKWDIDFDGIFETMGQNVLSLAYSMGDTHYVALMVTDDDGGTDIDTAKVIINNQPPVISDILDQVINEGESFSPIYLDEFVADPDNPDSTLTWEITGATNLLVQYDNTERVATINVIDQDWAGSDTLYFKVTDVGNKSDADLAIFTVNTVNDPPVAASIPNQSRYENESFSPLNLDNYVTDPDNPDSSLSWNYFGADEFQIDIINRLMYITAIDSEWAGIDTVGLIVSDPMGLKDTTSVIIEIKAVNDPPEVQRIPNQEIYKNEEFATFNLDEYVFDPDLPDSLIVWTWAGNTKLAINISQQRVLQITRIDTSWVGSETIVFWATDNEGLYDLFTTTFTVKPGVSNSVDANLNATPTKFALYANYPNPFNPHTNISYEIPENIKVEIRIYNMLGHEVKELVNSDHQPGTFQVTWDGRDNLGQKATSGVYYYRIKAGSFVRTRKMVLIY